MTADDQHENFQQTLRSLAQQQQRLLEQQQAMLNLMAETQKPVRKDIWDRLGSIAPILSGTIIALGGAYFTVAYNQQQLRLQEVQTIERFIPHLLGDEKSKRAAILAISSLTDDKLAAKVASIFASPGTVSALESIAANDTGGDRKDIKSALARALDNMAETYRMDKRYEDAIATYKKALELQEQSLGATNPELVPSLNRIAELNMIHKDFAAAEQLLRRATDIQKVASGAESVQFAAQLRRLASLYKEEGLDAKSQSFLNQAIAIEQKTPATTGSGAVGMAEHHDDGQSAMGATTGPDAKPNRVFDAPGEPRIIPLGPESANRRDGEGVPLKPPAPERGTQAIEQGSQDGRLSEKNKEIETARMQDSSLNEGVQSNR